jgi:hypothetical protein
MKRLELRFSEEELTTIEDLSGCNYSPERIALYLDVEQKDFLRLWYQKESEVRQRYNRGQLVSEFLVNQKQHELAKAGNITAAQIFLKEAEKNEVRNLRNKILFGDDY